MWEYNVAGLGDLNDFLKEGWEPFAVTCLNKGAENKTAIHLRRQVKEEQLSLKQKTREGIVGTGWLQRKKVKVIKE